MLKQQFYNESINTHYLEQVRNGIYLLVKTGISAGPETSQTCYNSQKTIKEKMR
jgi:hypothetical protein